MPTVSVIMPVYNGARYLKESINSVLMQTYRDFEFIIINDGSWDETKSLLDSFAQKDKRIKIITNPNNIGIAKSLNIGIKASKGKYAARIDADDVWRPNKLYKQIQHLANNADVAMLFTNVDHINENGQIIKKKGEDIFYTENAIKENILRNNFICHSSVIINKTLVRSIGFYNENYPNTEDYELWIRIIASLKVEMLEEKLVQYRLHLDMKSMKKRKEQIRYVIKAKFLGYKLIGFKYYYLIFLLKDLIYYLIPDWSLRLKKKLFSG